MLKTERAEFIRLKLDKHYPDPPIPLSQGPLHLVSGSASVGPVY